MAYVDNPTWVSDQVFDRIHANWDTGAFVDVDQDADSPSVESYTKPRAEKGPVVMWDDQPGTYIIFRNFCRPGAGEHDGHAHQTFKAVVRPWTDSSGSTRYDRHCLFLRLKADISPEKDYGPTTLYPGNLYVKYVRSDGAVITALGPVKSYDGYLKIAANVREIQLIGVSELLPAPYDYFEEVQVGFYMMRPYFVSPSNFHCYLPGSGYTRFCRPQTFDDGRSYYIGCKNSQNDYEALWLVGIDHPFASKFRVCTPSGDMALVAYE